MIFDYDANSSQSLAARPSNNIAEICKKWMHSISFLDFLGLRRFGWHTRETRTVFTERCPPGAYTVTEHLGYSHMWNHLMANGFSRRWTSVSFQKGDKWWTGAPFHPTMNYGKFHENILFKIYWFRSVRYLCTQANGVVMLMTIEHKQFAIRIVFRIQFFNDASFLSGSSPVQHGNHGILMRNEVPPFNE